MTTRTAAGFGPRPPGTSLDDAGARHLVASTPGFVVIAYSTAWSLACRLLSPIIDKLAIEFACKAAVARVDGDLALDFRRDHAISGIPQILVFEDGVLIDRLTDLDDPRLVRLRLRKVMRLPAAGPCGEAEHLFHEVHARAKRLFHDMTEPANRALRPHLDRIAPTLEALELKLAADRATGRIDDDMEMEQRSATFEAAFQPIRSELDALDRAERQALRAYTDLMDEAVDEYRILSRCPDSAHRCREVAV
ncbi:thioredoxin family protein [Phreatobacter sp.]|uniref:thioredoxin family protein n=1 Tax=Phreatobacter sp. TaxID=1966341 RepID=UPI003F70CB95